MISKTEYETYLGVTAPSNLERLEYLSLNALRSIMISNVPISTDDIYKDFLKALMEQINYFVQNPELIDEASSLGYTLGSFTEGNSSSNNNSESINKISPVAHDILLNCGLLYYGI